MKRSLALLAATAAVVLPTAPAHALDDRLEDPNACSSPYAGGADLPSGSVILLPAGAPRPSGTLPSPDMRDPYTQRSLSTIYQCLGGRWVPVGWVPALRIR